MDPEKGLLSESESSSLDETREPLHEEPVETKTGEESNDQGTHSKHRSPEKERAQELLESFPDRQLSNINSDGVQDSIVRNQERPSGRDLAAVGTSASLVVANDSVPSEESEEHGLHTDSKKRERVADPTTVERDGVENVPSLEKRPRLCEEGMTDEGNTTHGEMTVVSQPLIDGHGSPAGLPANSPIRTIEMSAAGSTLSPGIFDDADDDNTFDLDKYRRFTSYETMLLRPDLISAILGTRPKPKIVAPPVFVSSGVGTNVGQNMNKPVSVSSDGAKVDEQTLKESPKKKQVKKVLFTKKEQEAAAAALEGRIDLLKILPKEDCNFLAKEMWIFTLQQLELILDDDKNTLNLGTRNALVSKLARCTLTSNLTSIMGDSQGDVVKELDGYSENADNLKSSGEGQPRIPSRNLAAAEIYIPSAETKSEEFGKTERATMPSSPQHDKSQASENGTELDPEDAAVAASAILSSNVCISSSDGDKVTNKSALEVSEICEKSIIIGLANLAPLATEEKLDFTLEASTTVCEGDTVGTLADDSKGSSDGRKAAELKVALWMESIKEWKQQGAVSLDADQFPLDGPLSILFPAGTLHFIKSANIKTAHQYMCLKKTETGLVVEMFQNWRNKCGLRTIGMLPLAKHLLGINARLEVAIKSVDADKISWMSGAMVVVTGAAKDFIIDYCKIYCASQFVEMRTKFLADKLSDWRNSQGLPVLKGSGKVAMISAWKAGLRDEIEIESSKGEIVPVEDIQTEFKGEIVEPEQKKRKVDNGDLKPKKTSKSVESQLKQSLQYSSPAALKALNSDEFFATLFPEREKRRMLSLVEINTAQQYLDADKGQNSGLLKALIEMKSKNNDSKVQPASCVRLLYDWNARIKNKLDELESGTAVFEDSEIPIPGDSPKNHSPKTPVPRKTASEDPFDALSTTSKDFLASMNISSADQFLSARTSDIATAFIKWREEMKIVPLKGLGAVASVSGWKKLVRNKAFAVGDTTLAQLNQASNMKLVGESAHKSTEKKKEKKSEQGSVESLPRQENSKWMTTGGLSRHQFSALSVHADIVFHFELDVRQGLAKVDQVYLTYLGSDSASSVTECNSVERFNDACEIIEGSMSTLVDLGKVSAPMHGRSPYSSVTYGTIELSNRGVQPRVQDHAAVVVLKDSIKVFVMHPLTSSCMNDDNPKNVETLISEEKSKQPLDKRPIFFNSHGQRPLDGSSINEIENGRRSSSDRNYNMFETVTNGRKKFFLYLAKSIERGQSVELCFAPGIPLSAEWLSSADDSEARNWIRDQLGALSLMQLRALQVFLTNEIAPPIFCQLKDVTESPSVSACTDSNSFSKLGAALARRRLHWIANLVKRQLQKKSGHDGKADVLQSVPDLFDALHWNKDFLRKLLIDPVFISFVLPKVTKEVEQEITNAFQYEGFSGFAGTRVFWCPLAERLFRRIVHLCAELSVSFEELTSKDEDDFTEKVCHTVSQTIEALKQYALIDEKTALEDLVMTYTEGFSHRSKALPSVGEVKDSSYSKQYAHAMKLVGEMEIELPPRTEFQVVATIASASNAKSTQFSDFLDVSRRKIPIDVRWYLDRQVLPIMHCALRSDTTIFPPSVTRRYSILDEIESKILTDAQAAMADPDLSLSVLESTASNSEPVEQILPPQSLHFSNFKSNYQPHSSPFFLGFVWPILRGFGWRLSAGDNLSDVVYFPPDSGDKKTKRGKMKKHIMQEATQLARDTASVGFGYIPKLTKRLLVRCVQPGQHDLTGMKDTNSLSSARGSCSTSISSALKSFDTFLEESLRSDDKERECFLRQKAKDTMKVVSGLVEEVAPSVLFDEERFCKPEGDQWGDVLGCEHLMRVLILLPSILKETDLPFREHDQTVHIVRELIDFLARNHVELFASSFHLPKEDYEHENPVSSNVAVRLMKVFPPKAKEIDANNGDQVDDESIEVLHKGDRCNLTDFVAGVMSQIVIFRAKQEDVNRKGRRIPLGHPGLVCRHCLGQNGEGKYFFGSIESMTTASTVIEKHLLRCPQVPDAAREEIVSTRARHPDQRRELKPGVQGAFFAALFDRLRSMRVSDDGEVDESNLAFVSNPSVESFRHSNHTVVGASLISSSDVNTTDVSDGFKSYLDVMDFIQSTEPWKSNDSVVEMVEKYYNCLEYGGKIYNTATMPSHFSSEWLYAKIAPRK